MTDRAQTVPTSAGTGQQEQQKVELLTWIILGLVYLVDAAEHAAHRGH